MKKNICFAILVFCFACGSVRAQYEPFFKNFPIVYDVATPMTWYTDDYSPDNLGSDVWTFIIGINQNDTIRYGNLLYYYTNGDYNALIREDTNNGRIYRYYPEQDQELLWCDMSLNVGDTFQLPITEWNHYSEDGIYLVVDSIAYINGKKVIYFPGNDISHFYNSGVDNPESYFVQFNISLKFIEGIGPTYGPMGFLDMNGVEPYLGVLVCVSHQDSLSFMQHPDLGCYQMSANIKDAPNNSFHIYPTPATNHINIVFSETQHPDGDLFIIDMSGRVVHHFSIHQVFSTVNVNHLYNGFYTALYCDGKSVKSSVFFIKTK
ncbi:MAG TPA: T9SS type A sorting domain-containing protein [Bacteroidales bacterium]|nr:T9SS type A sorting domain-containing protein [Bacteroidales bacterium]